MVSPSGSPALLLLLHSIYCPMLFGSSKPLKIVFSSLLSLTEPVRKICGGSTGRIRSTSSPARGCCEVCWPPAFEAVKRIDAVLDVEREINRLSAEERLAVRRARARAATLIVELEQWMPANAPSSRAIPTWP
jgi:hypothetical protein